MKEQLGYRYLFKNIGLLTLSSFATKFLSFFLVPLYTSVLTTEEYGIYDLLNVTIAVLVPVLTLNIQEAVIRFSIDNKKSSEAIVNISVKYLTISNALVVVGLLLNKFLGGSPTIAKYAIYFFLMFLVQSLSGVLICYIRGIDKIIDLSISSVITSGVTIVCNILFLVVFKWGLEGYFLANIVGPSVQCIYLLFRSRFISFFKCKRYEIEEQEMIAYSKPLIANSVAWWINNVFDRYVIILFRGVAENGIYSVAGKIPSILNIFQSIFNQAWMLSAVKDFDSDDSTGFFSNTYKAYNCIMVLICSMIIVCNKILAEILYAKDFFQAWKYVPWLTIAILFGALSGYVGGFFSAVKESKIFAVSTTIGAIINIVFNFVFTPKYGAMGAAVSTTISYFFVWAYRFYQSKKYIRLRVSVERDLVTYMLLGVQSVFSITITGNKMYLYVVGVFLIICILYLEDIKIVISKVMRRKTA